MKNNAVKDITTKQANSHLKQISQNTDVFNPEKVKACIANAKTQKGKPKEPTTKNIHMYPKSAKHKDSLSMQNCNLERLWETRNEETSFVNTKKCALIFLYMYIYMLARIKSS